MSLYSPAVKPFTAVSFVLASALFASSGCVRRQMTINSEPSGALVYLNDREVGRTPLTTDFVWYGTYDVVLRKEGFETLHKRSRVFAPWWGYPPIDLAAEMMPWHPTDLHRLNYVMQELPQEPASALVDRAMQMKQSLPATQPSASAR